MAAGDIVRAVRAPGRLVADPTNLATTYPYGGVEVGKTRGVVIQSNGTPFSVESEGLGEVTDVLEAQNRYVFSCFLRGWDDDAVSKFLAANYAAGAVSGHAVFSVPGSVTPGESTSSRSVILLYVPDDLVHVNCVLIYNGIPHWSDGAEIAFQRGSELGIPLAVECLRDANDNMISMGRFFDLSLT